MQTDTPIRDERKLQIAATVGTDHAAKVSLDIRRMRDMGIAQMREWAARARPASIWGRRWGGRAGIDDVEEGERRSGVPGKGCRFFSVSFCCAKAEMDV